jgi:hypothetical protein
MKRLKAGVKPILYKESSSAIPRDVLLSYLRTCGRMILDEDNIREIVEESISKKIGLQNSEIEFQRDALEYNFQIERNYGCKYLSMIPMKHGNDAELINAAKDFMFVAMRSYLNCLKYRKEKYFGNEKSTKMMTKIQVLEFFEGSNALSFYFFLIIYILYDLLYYTLALLNFFKLYKR